MTKFAALHEFFSGFGIPAYVDSNVADDVSFPYLTYSPVADVWGNRVSIAVNVWYNTASESVPNAKAQEISNALPRYVLFDGGAILIDRGTPFCQSLSDQDNETIKRRYINIEAEFLTLK